jgi:hypothetical protein
MYKLTSPFSEGFTATWEMWKTYKWEVHHFRYNNPITEQAALNELVDLAEGDEEHAKRIVNRSMSQNWKGFWKTHNPAKDKKDGAASKKTTGGTTINDLKIAHSRRNGTEG